MVAIDLNRTIKTTTNETKTTMAKTIKTMPTKKVVVARTTITSAMLTRSEVAKITTRQISKTMEVLVRVAKKTTIMKRVKVVLTHRLMIRPIIIRSRMLRNLKSNRKVVSSSSHSIKSSRKKTEAIRTMGMASKVGATSKIEVVMDRASTRRKTIRVGKKMARSRCSNLRINQPKLSLPPLSRVKCQLSRFSDLTNLHSEMTKIYLIIHSLLNH